MFAREGARGISIVYLPQEEPDAKDAKALIEASGAQVLLLPADLMDENNCKAVVDKHIARFGTLNVLVNNASKQMCVLCYAQRSMRMLSST